MCWDGADENADSEEENGAYPKILKNDYKKRERRRD
jgi:hypothetical protein